MRTWVLAAVALLALPAMTGAALLPGPPPCDVPDVAPGAVRVDGGPNEVLRVRFALPADLAGTLQVRFALRASTLSASLPAERGLAAGFLETTASEDVAIVSPQLGVYPYGAQAGAGPADLRVAAVDGGCWGAFGATRDLALAAGAYDFIVLGASEAGSRFAAFLPSEAEVQSVARGPAALLSAGTLACPTKARAFASGLLAEAILDCSTPLEAGGRAYRSLVATWGPSDLHDVRWTDPSGAPLRCYKAPGWCVDTGAGPAGTWSLEVERYVTLRQPSIFLPGGVEGFSGLFGAFAGRP